jgi:hypothetical protein
MTSKAWDEAEKIKQKKKTILEKQKKKNERNPNRPVWGQRRTSWKPKDFDRVQELVDEGWRSFEESGSHVEQGEKVTTLNQKLTHHLTSHSYLNRSYSRNRDNSSLKPIDEDKVGEDHDNSAQRKAKKKNQEEDYQLLRKSESVPSVNFVAFGPSKFFYQSPRSNTQKVLPKIKIIQNKAFSAAKTTRPNTNKSSTKEVLIEKKG